MVISVVVQFIFILVRRKWELKCDEIVKSPQDFTLYLKGIPTEKNLFSQRQIREFINELIRSKVRPEERGEPDPPLDKFG